VIRVKNHSAPHGMSLRQRASANMSQKTLAKPATDHIIVHTVKRRETQKPFTRRGFARESLQKISDGGARVRQGTVCIPPGRLMQWTVTTEYWSIMV
jgi:hypothetical protein